MERTINSFKFLIIFKKTVFLRIFLTNSRQKNSLANDKLQENRGLRILHWKTSKVTTLLIGWRKESTRLVTCSLAPQARQLQFIEQGFRTHSPRATFGSRKDFQWSAWYFPKWRKLIRARLLKPCLFFKVHYVIWTKIRTKEKNLYLKNSAAVFYLLAHRIFFTNQNGLLRKKVGGSCHRRNFLATKRGFKRLYEVFRKCLCYCCLCGLVKLFNGRVDALEINFTVI